MVQCFRIAKAAPIVSELDAYYREIRLYVATCQEDQTMETKINFEDDLQISKCASHASTFFHIYGA